MLNICEKYARKYDILFNATKSQLLYFGKVVKMITYSQF